VTLKADAGPATPGAARPTGTITLSEGAKVLGTLALGSGPVSLQETGLTKGGHTYTASYTGDGNYLAEGTILTVTV
jgi:Bacterial Ig-like domain (group 3)